MKKYIFVLFCFVFVSVMGQNKIPMELDPWIGWATWDSQAETSPHLFNNEKKYFTMWPSSLNLNLNKEKGNFTQKITAYGETWVYLPGSNKNWPFNVRCNGNKIPVTNHLNSPGIKLKKGTYIITGDFYWKFIPGTIKIPKSTGIVNLKINGKKVAFPERGKNGILRLQNKKSILKDKDYLSTKAYYLLEDGIPLKLHINIGLTVSGKSREKVLETVVPTGWKVSSIVSQIPATIDKFGKLKVQVRSGKWSIKIQTFRTDNTKIIEFQKGAKIISEKSFLAFKSAPELRVLEVQAGESIDSSGTSLPDKWKEYPVYFWITKKPILLKEQQRGGIANESSSITVNRELWLFEKGHGYTFIDSINAELSKTLRLDSNGNNKLGKVTVNGVDLLITENPISKTSGVELREKSIFLEAVGKIEHSGKIPISGWKNSVDSVNMKINLPPGWRVFAVFGADKSYGDWLSSWNLLDIFLLLLFSTAMFRIWGLKAGIMTFIGFALIFHEPGSPKYIWFFLLIPVSLLKVIKEGIAEKLLKYWKHFALICFVLITIPFIAKQAQNILYPQLERTVFQRQNNINYASTLKKVVKIPTKEEKRKLSLQLEDSDNLYAMSQSNLSFTPSTKVQTGPGIPLWSWNSISCNWNRAVTASENITPILISPFFSKILGLGRILFILLILNYMFEVKISKKSFKSTLLLFLLCCFSINSFATVPDKDTLSLLKLRVLKTADCYPNCAEIENLTITLKNRKIINTATVHAQTLTAFPMPGQPNSWSPITITVDGKPAPLRIENNYLWVVVNKGIHIVKATGIIPVKNTFELSFYLKPHKVTINAPHWKYSGLNENNAVESQIFFSKKQKTASVEKEKYSMENFNPIVVVERHLELGQSWQVITTVTRLTSSEKPIALSIPIIPNEKLLSSALKITDNKYAEVRLSAGQHKFMWKSELPISNKILFNSTKNSSWVEQWSVVYSAMWNVNFKGIPPIYKSSSNILIPSWKPWPGEQLELKISKPKAIQGQTVTLKKVNFSGTPGTKITKYSLVLDIVSSVGAEYPIILPENSTVKSVFRNEKKLSAKIKGRKITLPLIPGKQNIKLMWTVANGISLKTQMGKVTLPAEATNIYSSLSVPRSRWIILTGGPTMGPAVRFWGLFIVVLIIAFVLGSTKNSPLSKTEWVLLSIGMTQVPIFLALFIISWLFWLKWRGEVVVEKLPKWVFNLQQIVLIGLTCISLFIFIGIVYEGLMGRPEMYIVGNGSNISNLYWYKAEVEKILPTPYFISMSIWIYRLSMLLWALWLSNALIKWLKWGFKQFSHEKYWV